MDCTPILSLWFCSVEICWPRHAGCPATPRAAAKPAHSLPGRRPSWQDTRALFFFADGFNGDADQLCSALGESAFPLAGGLSSGDLHTGHSYQIAGPQTGNGALAAAFLRGDLRVGVGSAHGWNPVGSQFRVTRSRGFWLRTLDGRPASETYAQLFGYPARDWAFPPLSHLARLYPLGVEQGDQLLVRAPIRVEADGSFRMNAPVRDGADAYLLVGSRVSCENAAQRAVQQALQQLEGRKPVFALLLVDIAWEMLLKSHPGAEISAVKDILGEEVPIAGGYTLGQVVPGRDMKTPSTVESAHHRGSLCRGLNLLMAVMAAYPTACFARNGGHLFNVYNDSQVPHQIKT